MCFIAETVRPFVGDAPMNHRRYDVLALWTQEVVRKLPGNSVCWRTRKAGTKRRARGAIIQARPFAAHDPPGEGGGLSTGHIGSRGFDRGNEDRTSTSRSTFKRFGILACRVGSPPEEIRVTSG